MASPQRENGFTAIANELLERVVNTHLLGAEFQVVLCILRKTYGYQKKQDVISLSQFQRATSLSRPTIVKTLKNLQIRKMIVKVYLPDDKIAFSFNKDYDKWVVKEHLLVKDKWVTSKGVFTESSKSPLTHNRKKETNTKEIAETSSAPFSLKEEIKKLEGNPRRDLNIIALYFEERSPDLKSKPQFVVALKRHLRAAKNLVPFTDNQILNAVPRAKKITPDWTLETLEKILTK